LTTGHERKKLGSAAPDVLEVHYEEPVERLWRDLKDWLAHCHPTSLAQLSKLLGERLRQYSSATLCSLTGFPSLLSAAQLVTVL
jgi:hypothetical protein